MVTVSGGKGLEEALRKLSQKISQKATLRVGFLEDKRYEDGTPVATIAAINNFGGGNTPPRPFFSNMIADNSKDWGDKLASLLERTGNDVEKSLSLLGEVIAGQLRLSIADTNAPPNSMVTNILKQRYPMGGYAASDVWQAFADAAGGMTAPAGKPLVWTGTMLDSVSYEVEK